MAAGRNAHLKALLDHAQIVLHGLFSGHVELVEDVVVRTGDQDAGLPEAHGLDQLKVLVARTDPACDLRVAVPPLPALFDRLPVLLVIEEELALADQAAGAAQPVKVVINGDHLLGGVGLPGLLAITEGGIGDPDLVGHVVGNNSVVEGYLRHLRIGKEVPEGVGVVHIHQGVHVELFQLQEVRAVVHSNGSLAIIHNKSSSRGLLEAGRP